MEKHSGKVVTVLGDIDPADLGVTHMHEHVFTDALVISPDKQSGHAMAYAAAATDMAKFNEPISLSNYYDAHRNEFLYKDAMHLVNFDDAVKAVTEYRAAGGGTLAEVTPMGHGRDPEALKRVSRLTAVNIVMGTGYYTHDYHPEPIGKISAEDVAELIVSDIVDGAGTSRTRPGIIGEVGLTWPLHPDEAKVLTATAIAQQRTGLTVTVHPGRNAEAPMSAVRIFEKGGGDLSRLIIGHLDRTLFDLESMVQLASAGCILEFDLFGWEQSYYPVAPIDMPNDAIRVNFIVGLFEAGFREQVTVGQDISNKLRYTSYGGEGYQHILDHIVPLMLRKGLSDEDVAQILVETPRRLLTIP